MLSSPKLLSTSTNNWDVNFKVDWTVMPRDVQQAVLRHNRPSAKQRKHMVRIIVDKIRKDV